MDDKTLQKKLNQLAKIAQEIHQEAQRRYGPDGMLFYESEGGFHVMDGDSYAGSAERQKHCRFRSEGFCQMGCGAW